MHEPPSSRLRERAFRQSRGKPKPEKEDSPDQPKKPARPYVKLYLRYLRPYRAALILVLGLALITALLDLVWPLAIKYIFDGVLPSNRPDKPRLLAIFGGGIVALLILKQSIDTTRSWRMDVLDAKLTVRLRRRLFQRLLRLSLSDLAEMKSGGIVSRLSADIDSVTGLVHLALISPVVAVIRIILTIAILFFLSWRLAIAAMFLIPPLAIISFVWLRRVRPIYRSAVEDRNNVDARVSETFGGIRVVRAFRRESREEKSYALGRHTILRKWLHATKLELVLQSAWGLLIPGTSLLIVWYGAHLVLSGKAQIGDIFAFQIYAVLLLEPVWRIVSSVSQTQKSMAALERVFDAIEMNSDKPDAEGAIDAPKHVRDLRFDHVTFEYRPAVPVLSDITLTIPGGSVVALVGPSGAGKTTLTDLVARFHDPTSGSIQLNGHDLRSLKLSTYRDLLAIVQQETFLFDGTVRENIAYGLRHATDDQVRDAAQRANAHEFIAALPEQYETLIGERGFKLSGGQKQRISIARAILADPQILILDEATSNLDTESEQLIQASMSELLKNRTTFVIAHRLSTVTHADLIVVLDQGRVVESGPHDALMEKRGLYHDMVTRQRASLDQTTLDASPVMG
jgi:ATP-binding cassette, subfamily B, bacterial